MRHFTRAVKLTAIPVVAAAGIGIGVVTLGGGAAGADDRQVLPTAPGGKAVAQKHVGRVPNTTGITGVLAYNTKGYPASGKPDHATLQHNHVHSAVKYSVIPPVGGPHSEKWMNAGTYTKPIPSERAVHNLEHGAVWITYSPDLSKTQVAALRTFAHKQTVLPEGRLEKGGPVQGNRFIDLSPWRSDSLGAPIVISSWGYQLKVQSASDPRLQKFVDTFRRNDRYSPESDAPVDGVDVSIGGRASSNGGTYPNPD
ncbi:MAG: DUF3105 domain-containing protein [Williamsia herbipolensis]|nr:DUF3105 domain-containing protein [Williamsia herbipolensis]